MTQPPPITPGHGESAPAIPEPDQPRVMPPVSPPPYYPPQQPGYYPPYGPPVPQVVTKPGGLSGAAHAVHILISFFTCGLWLIPYAIIAAMQPAARYEVVVPVGADPAAVQAAYAQAAQANLVRRIELTPEQKAARRRSLRDALIVTGGVFLLLGGIALAVLLTS